MEQAKLHDFEAQCVQEEAPACQSNCPLHLEVRNFITLMAEEKFTEARKVMERTMPLAGLLGYLCSGYCLEHCYRQKLDSAVNLPLLERFCVSVTAAPKPFPLPASNKKICIVGSAVSSLVAAWELGKKGHSVTILHLKKPGSGILAAAAERLPAEVLPTTLELLASVRVKFEQISQAYTKTMLDKLTSDYQVIYLGLDDQELFSPQAVETISTDPVTLETDSKIVFAGGKNLSREFILAAADGRRATGSIDRCLQGVSPSAAREKEGTYPSSLHVNMQKRPLITPVTPENPLQPSQEEALAEAARCIRCECLECLNFCPYLKHYKGYPKRYAREIYNNLSVVHGLRQANTMTNSCAECGLCSVICPKNANMGTFCALAKQEMVKTNRMPPSAHEFALQDMEHSNSPEISFARHQPGADKSRYLLFPGCQLPASAPQQTVRLYEYLCTQLTGGLGLMSGCCGAPAKWSGRNILSRITTDNFWKKWQELGKPQVIIACASCLNFFRQELPEIPVMSLWVLLKTMPLPSGAKTYESILALHDPCAARSEQETCASIRDIAKKLGQKIEELPLSKKKTRCCGYGGLADSANPQAGKQYAEARIQDSENTMLAYCIMCRDRLRQNGKETLHLLDLLFPVQSLEEAALRNAPGISTRQENRHDFKRDILKKIWQEEVLPMPDAPLFTMAEGVAEKLEIRRILHSDVANVLVHAEQNTPLFIHPESGHCLSALRPRQVTFWIEYEKLADGSYIVHDAYCHRMVVPEVPGEGAASPCSLEGYAIKGGRL